MKELVVGGQAAVARRSAAVQDAFDKNAQIRRPALGRSTGRGRLALDRDAQAGLFRVVDGDVEGEDLSLLPRQLEEALLAGPARDGGLHLSRQLGTGRLRRLRFLFHLLARDEQAGQPACGDVSQHGHHFALAFARHLKAVDFQQSVT